MFLLIWTYFCSFELFFCSLEQCFVLIWVNIWLIGTIFDSFEPFFCCSFELFFFSHLNYFIAHLNYFFAQLNYFFVHLNYFIRSFEQVVGSFELFLLNWTIYWLIWTILFAHWLNSSFGVQPLLVILNIWVRPGSELLINNFQFVKSPLDKLPLRKGLRKITYHLFPRGGGLMVFKWD